MFLILGVVKKEKSRLNSTLKNEMTECLFLFLFLFIAKEDEKKNQRSKRKAGGRRVSDIKNESIGGCEIAIHIQSDTQTRMRLFFSPCSDIVYVNQKVYQ